MRLSWMIEKGWRGGSHERRSAGEFSTKLLKGSIGGHALRFLFKLASELFFQSCQLRFDLFARLALLDDLLAIAAQEVINGFHADPDRARGLVFVEILKAEIRCARLLDDSFDDTIDWRIVAALETGNFERNQVGVTRGE